MFQKAAIPVALVLIFGLLAALEVFTRVVVERHSKVQEEVNQEYKEAIALDHGGGGGQPEQLLVVGNSLVGQDLDFPLLVKGLAPEWRTHRLWIHATGYEDWYYGLRRLFAEGARPKVVAITLAAMHWYTSGIRGDYSALYLFKPADIPTIGVEVGLDRTKTSDLFFARFSRFYALRAEIRKEVLKEIFPDLPRMYDLFKPTAAQPLTSSEVLSVVGPRLKRMHDLAATYGVRIILIVPPVPRPGQEFQEELQNAAKTAEVSAVIPLSCEDLQPADFEDDVHLTTAGAEIFTERLIGPLRGALAGVNRGE
jgi:hypothetical protein